MAGFGEVQEQYTKDLERDLKQARKQIKDLEVQLAKARFAVKTLIGLNEIAYNEGYNDRQKHNKKDYEKTKSSLKVKQLKGKANE